MGGNLMTAFGTPPFDVGQVVTSFAQDGFWLLDRLAPGTATHRIYRAYQVSGPLDLQALRAAWRTVVDRHDVLRTTLVEAGGELMQRVAARSSPSVSFVDLGHVSPADRDAHADRLSARAAAESIDLAVGPLARLTVFRLTTVDHRVVLVVHRAAADDSSVSILLQELSTYYARAVRPAGDVPALSDRPAQYADYARWQRGQETEPAFQRLLGWWTSALRPLPPPLVLPVDRDCRAAAPGRVDVVGFDWGEGLGRQLAALCRAEHTTPLAVMLAAFWSLLHRYSGEGRVAVGAPVAVRPAQFADVVGPCENVLMLCGDLVGSVTFRELVRQATRTTREALDHRGLPFVHLVRALNPAREPGRIPLCDAMLDVREEPEVELSLAGAGVRRCELDRGFAPARLMLTVHRLTPSVAGRLEYRREELDRETVVAVLDQLRTLLAAGLAAPDTPSDELPLDSPQRAREAARAAGETAAGAVAVELVHQTVRRRAEQTPAAEAVASASGTVTYGQLERGAALVAAYLAGLGANGSAVAIRMNPGPRQVAVSLGALHAGAHIVWFGTGDAGERGRTVLAELRPACLVLEGDPARDDLARWYRDELGGMVVDVTALDLDTAFDSAGVLPPAGDPIGLDQTAYVAYTSGSTGKPKGIAQSHGAFAQFVSWMAGVFQLGPGSRVAQWAAPEHDPALCEVFATLVSGGTLCPVPDRIRAHPEKLVGWLAQERITFLQTVPSFARELLKAIDGTGAAGRLGALDRIVLMGEALPADLANGLRAALPHIRLANIYGPTETIAATWYEITDDVVGTVPIGRSIPGRQVLVLDERDRPCPTGFTGEIVIRSRYVAPGYVGDRTAGDAFRLVSGYAPGEANGVRCYRTGDLARRRWDGLLEFRGRRDLQVKLYGTRVELAEVEAALAEHDSVAECVVVPLTDRDGLVVRLVAYVVPRRTSPGGAVAGPEAWRGHLRRRFGASMTLVSFETLSGRLPRNIGGKVDRHRLPAPRAVLAQVTRAPWTWVEEAMAEIWSQLLGVHRVEADETFFAAGGHSLLVPRLVDRIRQRFGVEIPLRECFAHSTLAGMSALVSAACAERATPAVERVAAQVGSTGVDLVPRR